MAIGTSKSTKNPAISASERSLPEARRASQEKPNERRQGVGNFRRFEDQLEPRKHAERRDGRPEPEPRWVGEPQSKPGARCEQADRPLDPGKDDGPRVDGRPEVAHHRGHIGKPHPPDDPDERWREIVERVLRAEQPGGQDQDEETDRNRTNDSGHRRVKQNLHRPDTEQVDANPVGVRRPAVQDQRHDHEGKSDRAPRSDEVEVERQRQVIAWAERVSLDRRRAEDHRRGGAQRQCRSAEVPHAQLSAGRFQGMSAYRQHGYLCPSRGW